MDPRLRNPIIVVLAVIVSLVAAVGLAGENYLVSLLALALVGWIAAEWSGGPWPEAWVLAVVLAGYTLGNRGFAQFSPTAQLPLLPAETALLVTVPACLIRAAFGGVSFFRRDALNYLILAWIVAGAARLPLDLSRHGFVALRDFALIYYASFFFVGQAMARHAASTTAIRRALSFAFAALPAVATAYQRAPEFFFRYTSVRGVPLIFHKSDLIATSLAAGFFWFWTSWEQNRRKIALVFAGLCLVAIAPLPSPRAAMVAVAVVTGLWLLARRWRLVAFQGVVVALGLAALVPTLVFFEKDLRETSLYSAYEHALSIVDVQGRGAYVNTASGDPGDNNRFRLVWWRAVAREAWENNPVFGLGFGYDLSAQFLVDYDWLTVEEFSARSPHSMLLTMLGRMGLVGLGLWLAIAAMMWRRTRAAFRASSLPEMGLWSVTWVFWISACFGVVLEGPMGAVVFWTMLGLAQAETVDAGVEPLTDTNGALTSKPGSALVSG